MCATSPIGYFYIHNSCNQTVSFTLTVSLPDRRRPELSSINVLPACPFQGSGPME